MTYMDRWMSLNPSLMLWIGIRTKQTSLIINATIVYFYLICQNYHHLDHKYCNFFLVDLSFSKQMGRESDGGSSPLYEDLLCCHA